MRPSISVTLEPGLERGVPWGRDLYTFVTSAAGHMMRTLQKPRKNRPSKRQVNHRRFLHNMIQRKFADIEAANHRLASALYFKDEEKNVSSLQSQEPEVDGSSRSGHVQHPEKCTVHTSGDDISKSGTDVSTGSHQTEKTEEKKHPDSQHLWKRHPKSQPTNCTARKNNKGKGRKKKGSRNHEAAEFTSISSPKGTDYYKGAELLHAEYYDDESPLKSTNDLSEDTQTALQNSGLIQFDQNMDISPSFSPELSPLSLDSHDFSIQMFTDVSTCAQAQRSIADIAESPWTDIMELFGIGNKDFGGCVDIDDCFESICACQGDAEQEVAADDFTFADQSDGFTERICSHRPEVEDLHCVNRYEYGYSCHGDQGNHAAETEFDHFKPSHSLDITQNQLATLISCHYSVSHPQTYQRPQEESPCVLPSCENNLHFTPFEGVAQSFSAPHHNPEDRPIPTPPHEDDWLFTDILKDRKSPDC